MFLTGITIAKLKGKDVPHLVAAPVVLGAFGLAQVYDMAYGSKLIRVCSAATPFSWKVRPETDLSLKFGSLSSPVCALSPGHCTVDRTSLPWALTLRVPAHTVPMQDKALGWLKTSGPYLKAFFTYSSIWEFQGASGVALCVSFSPMKMYYCCN